MHQLLQRCWLHLQVKDRAHHRLSTSFSKSCHLRSRGISPHGPRPNQRRMKRGGSPSWRTSLYVHLDHVHLNTITHRQKEEEQHNKKVCFLSHVSIRHVDSNPMLHAHREKQKRTSRKHRPQNEARSRRSRMLSPVPSCVGLCRVLVVIVSWLSLCLSRCHVLIIVRSSSLLCLAHRHV